MWPQRRAWQRSLKDTLTQKGYVLRAYVRNDGEYVTDNNETAKVYARNFYNDGEDVTSGAGAPSQLWPRRCCD